MASGDGEDEYVRLIQPYLARYEESAKDLAARLAECLDFFESQILTETRLFDGEFHSSTIETDSAGATKAYIRYRFNPEKAWNSIASATKDRYGLE